MSDVAEKRKIVLGVTGSIAAYKAAEIARYFMSRGYQVRVVLSSWLGLEVANWLMSFQAR